MWRLRDEVCVCACFLEWREARWPEFLDKIEKLFVRHANPRSLKAITLSLHFYFTKRKTPTNPHTRASSANICTWLRNGLSASANIRISSSFVATHHGFLSSRLIFYCPDLDKRPNYLKVLLCVFSGDFFYRTDGWLFTHRLWLPSVLRLRYPLRFFFSWCDVSIITWPNFLIAPP